MMTRNEFAYKAHKNAKEKGFWKERLSNEHCLMLVITEIGEMVEADRKGKRADIRAFNTRQCVGRGSKDVTVSYEYNFGLCIKDTVEDEFADITIRLFDLAGALGVDFDKMKPCNYHRAFDKFTFTENAFALTKGLSRDKIGIERRILFGLDYIFNWANSIGIDLWLFIEHKMRYNSLRTVLHGKRY